MVSSRPNPRSADPSWVSATVDAAPVAARPWPSLAGVAVSAAISPVVVPGTDATVAAVDATDVATTVPPTVAATWQV